MSGFPPRVADSLSVAITTACRHGKLARVTDRGRPPGPPKFAWAVASMCFGVALILVALLLYATHPEWF